MTESEQTPSHAPLERLDSAMSVASDSSDDHNGTLRLSRYATNIEGTFDGAEPVQIPFHESGHDGEQADSVAPLGKAGKTFSASGSASGSSTVVSPPAASASAQYTPSTSTPGTSYSWSSSGSYVRPRGGSGSVPNGVDGTLQPPSNGGTIMARSNRPSVARTPSHAYAPPRRPSQYTLSEFGRHRSSSANRNTRLNPDADYRAQKKAYVQRLQLENADESAVLSPEGYAPSLTYSTGSETDDESPSTADYVDNDPYDQETLLYIDHQDVSPSAEELKIPANRERLEWHSMLANVLTGDVVRQEKKRLTGTTEQHGDNTLRNEVWTGIRAKVCGRTLVAQKRVLEDRRSKALTDIEAIIAFEIKGETEVGKTSREQVEDIVKKIENVESLYPTRQALEAAHPRAGSDAYKDSCAAIISWHNTTALINTELGILQTWVGNEELDFSKPRERQSCDSNLTDESSFIDRILKEDGLKSLQRKHRLDEEGKNSLLDGVEQVINKAKATLIENAAAFSAKHLPPYIEELLTLINFPTRLVQEIIRMRLSYATKIRDPALKGVMMTEQMISQFQILLNLAVKIKEAYVLVSQPEPGWDLPPCIDENFDHVVLDALKYYFKMLNYKLASNMNTFKEAEILEQEWAFSNELGRHFEGGDVEVAEQFSSLTSKSLSRLTTHFEKELRRRPNEVAGSEMDRRYKSILDSVRVRQRKLFRFSRLLSQTFENTAEYSINMQQDQLQELCDDLMFSSHVLIKINDESENTYIVASPSLQNRPREIQSILKTCYRAEDSPDDPSNPYVLVLQTENPILWEGQKQSVDMKLPGLDVKTGKLRIVAEGALHLLQNAKLSFLSCINMELDVVIPQRANLQSVEKELAKIRKTASKLSSTIIDSVEIIRKQLDGLDCHELIQMCFAFATEFGQRSLLYMDPNRRALNNHKLTRLALDWVSFICDDCIASERKTFRWAVVALEFAMVMTRGQNILSISDEEYATLRSKVAGCMSLLISHFDIMGARSSVAAQAEKQRLMDSMGGKYRLDVSKLKDDEESTNLVREQWMRRLQELDESRDQSDPERQWLGRVLEDSNEADRSLTFLSSSATNVTLRWQQGQYIGGGTFGSVYAAINLDSNSLMAVKEIRLQDPQLIPSIVGQIRDEMGVLQILDHPNIVSYYGIEVHRDKVYIFMEYCSGGSLAGLLEQGRIEDETVIVVYALQLLEGLAYLHESGVVHRDIKPENILLDHLGRIKYVDFGAAKIIARQTGRTIAGSDANNAAGRQRGERQKSMTGTPMYMSPEAIKGTSFSAAANVNSSTKSDTSSASAQTTQGRPGAVDTWSLGCVVLEMATGRRPWATLDNEWAIMYNIAQGNSPQLPTRDQLSDAGIDFLKKCFERDPAKRASAAELLQHEWIMALRNQLRLEPQSSNSAAGSNSGNTSSEALSRTNT